jgi:hypothetical protein
VKIFFLNFEFGIKNLNLKKNFLSMTAEPGRRKTKGGRICMRNNN